MRWLVIGSAGMLGTDVSEVLERHGHEVTPAVRATVDLAELADLRQRHVGAREAAADAREALHELREARWRGMVAELSAVLVDGDPCLVCGALDHPDPAEVQGDGVGREQEVAAERDAERLRTGAEELGSRVSAAEATCAATSTAWRAGTGPRISGRSVSPSTYSVAM